MKKRTLKKIVLTRETLRSLDDQAVREAAGGFTGGNPASCNASCITEQTRQCSVCDPCIGTGTGG
jgi:hypothetical protein